LETHAAGFDGRRFDHTKPGVAPRTHVSNATVDFGISIFDIRRPDAGRLATVMVVDSGPSIRYMTKDRCQA
jgi:hypothetical protein